MSQLKMPEGKYSLLTGHTYVSLGRFPFVRSVRSDRQVLKWSARVLRTGSLLVTSFCCPVWRIL